MNPETLLLLIQLTSLTSEILKNSQGGHELTPDEIKDIEARQAAAVANWKTAIGAT